MKRLLVLLLLVSYTLNAQISSVPSPNSFMQTKYSNVSLNESTGVLLKNIPLLNYTVGKLNVPISITHTGNAVKVVQIPSWTGVNWNLNAGGVVTRIVNDYPDEKASERIFLDDIEALGAGFEMQAYSYIESEGDTRDYRVDLFSFSFAGYSGSFYLDESFTPILTDKSVELKIEFVGGISATTDNTIKITTPDGNIYYFGGVTASEYSSSLVEVKKKGNITYDPITGYFDVNEVTQDVSPLATTSFYLFKIENMFGDQVLFDYLDDGTKTYTLYERQELPYPDYSNYVNEGCWDLDDFGELKSSVFKVSIHNSRKLSKIHSISSDLEVNFTSSDLFLPAVGTIPTPQYDDKKLDRIQLYDNQISENLKNIDFNYLLPHGSNSYRFYLEEIKINNSDDILADECEKYSFEYNSPESLPDRFSYDVDLLGFYNASGNIMLLSEDQNAIFDESFQNLAVRESNFETASKGVLAKINYPTGGSQVIDYEAPKVVAVVNHSNSLRIYRNKYGNPSTKATHSFNVGGEISPAPDTFVSTNPVDQDLILKVNATVTPDGTYVHDKIWVEVENLTQSTMQTGYISFVNNEFDYVKYFSFSLLKDNNYRVTLRFDNTNPTSGEAGVEANLTAYYKSQELMSTLGIRVKSISALDENDEVKGYKRYFYKKHENIGEVEDESAVVSLNSIQQVDYEKYCCDESNIENSFHVVRLIADPLQYYFNGSDNQMSYRYVTTSFGDDFFEGGGVEKHFLIDDISLGETKTFLYGTYLAEIEGNYFGSNLSNERQYSGLLKYKKILKKEEDNSLVVQSVDEYNYVRTFSDELKSIIVKKRADYLISDNSCLLPDDEFVGAPAIGYYSNYSYSNKLVSVETTIMKEDLSGYQGVMSTLTEYEYDSLNGLVTRVSSNDSKGNLQITEYKYPTDSDIATLSFAPSYITAYNDLKNRNIVGLPIETTKKYKYSDGTEKTISKTATLFKQESGFVVPEKTVQAKGDEPYEGEIENTLFDAKGNLLEVTQEGVFKKSYIYGYNDNVVIAEVNNYAYNSIPMSTINNLKNLSDNIVDETSMNNLKVALDQLRLDLPEAIITTFVYDEYNMLRITTDSRGMNVYQDYDDCRRPKMIRDNDLNVIKEYKYNLNQN